MTDTPRRPRVVGPEDWAELGGRWWTWWDLWFCAVAVADHGGSLEGLEGTESKLSHLADLRARLVEVGLAPLGRAFHTAGLELAGPTTPTAWLGTCGEGRVAAGALGWGVRDWRKTSRVVWF
jgi:hypothetical protein